VESKDVQLLYQSLNEGVPNNQAGANGTNNTTSTYVESNTNNNTSTNQSHGLESTSIPYLSS